MKINIINWEDRINNPNLLGGTGVFRYDVFGQFTDGTTIEVDTLDEFVELLHELEKKCDEWTDEICREGYWMYYTVSPLKKELIIDIELNRK